MSEQKKPTIDHSAVAEEINESVNYAMYAVFRFDRAGGKLTGAGVDHMLAALEELGREHGLTVRGWYNISGFRADADVLVWLHAPHTDALQSAYRSILVATDGAFVPVWSNIGVHRAAEFNRGHVPAFLAGEEPKRFVCVYPFVRSYEWYLLPEEERSRMLREHGGAARDYGDVLANTISAFALGDYEWLLAFESDELVRIVDLMRELRAVDARMHVREEVPFFTGPSFDPRELVG